MANRVVPFVVVAAAFDLDLAAAFLDCLILAFFETVVVLRADDDEASLLVVD